MKGKQFTVFLGKNLISSGSVLLSLVLVIIIYWRSGALPSVETELADKILREQRYATNLNYATSLREHHEAAATVNKEIEVRLVRVFQLPQNLQYFYKIEHDTGVKITDLRQQTQPLAAAKSGAKTSLIPVAFALSVQGNYSAMINFLQRLESGAHYSRMLSCSMNAGGSAGLEPAQGRKLTLSLNVELLGLP